jgi:hypothetical protein
VGGFYLLTFGEILFLIKERFGKKSHRRDWKERDRGRDLYDSHFACAAHFRTCTGSTAVTERRLERESMLTAHAHRMIAA